MTQSLTVSDVLTLRLSAHSLRHTGGGMDPGFPFILYLPADDAFCLNCYGAPQAVHKDPALLAELLRQERAEPGFIRRMLSAAEPPDLATLDPAARVRQRSALAAESARQRQAALDSTEARREAAARLRYVPAVPLTDISLDDL